MRFTSTRQGSPSATLHLMFFFKCSSTLLALFLRKAGMISSSTFLAYSVKSGNVSIACNNVAQGRTSPQGDGFKENDQSNNRARNRIDGQSMRIASTTTQGHSAATRHRARSGPPTLFSIVRYSTTRLWRGSVSGASNSSVQPGWNLGGMGMFWGCARHASTDAFLLAAGTLQVQVQHRAMPSCPGSTPTLKLYWHRLLYMQDARKL